VVGLKYVSRNIITTQESRVKINCRRRALYLRLAERKNTKKGKSTRRNKGGRGGGGVYKKETIIREPAVCLGTHPYRISRNDLFNKGS